VYSPKIAERLVPRLYWLAKARGQPMTTLVAEIIEEYLGQQQHGGDVSPDVKRGAGPVTRAAQLGVASAAATRRPRRIRRP
jgi:predicted DNA-binding protein